MGLTVVEPALTIDNALILDVLQDDVQPLPLILSARESVYTGSTRQNLRSLFETLKRLAKDGFVVAYRELAIGIHFELAVLPPDVALRETDWFGLTKIGLSTIEDLSATGPESDSARAGEGDWGKIWRPDRETVLGRLASAYEADPKLWTFQGSTSRRANSRDYRGAVILKALLRSRDGNQLVLVHFVRQGEPYPFGALVRGYFRLPITDERFEQPGFVRD